MLKKICFIHILLLIIMINLGNSYNYINSLPYTISSSGKYMLNNSITNYSGTNGITISSNDVLLDLGGKILDGNGTNYGIRINTYSNITITNGTISEWLRGISFVDSGNTYNDIYLKDLYLNNSVNDIYFDGYGPTGGNKLFLENITVFNKSYFRDYSYVGTVNTNFFGPIDFRSLKDVEINNSFIHSCGIYVYYVTNFTKPLIAGSNLDAISNSYCFILDDEIEVDLNGNTLNGNNLQAAIQVNQISQADQIVNFKNGFISNWTYGITTTSNFNRGYLIFENISFYNNSLKDIRIIETCCTSETKVLLNNSIISSGIQFTGNILNISNSFFESICGNSISGNLVGELKLISDVYSSSTCMDIDSEIVIDFNGYSLIGNKSTNGIVIDQVSQANQKVIFKNGVIQNWTNGISTSSNFNRGQIFFENMTFFNNSLNGFRIVETCCTSETQVILNNSVFNNSFLFTGKNISIINTSFQNICGLSINGELFGALKLSNDIVTSSSCITVESDLTLDLNGYKLDGNKSSSDGIILDLWYSTATIKNGVISNWFRGIDSGSNLNYGTILISNVTFINNSDKDLLIDESCCVSSLEVNITNSDFSGNLIFRDFNTLNFFMNNITSASNMTITSVTNQNWYYNINGSNLGNYWKDFTCDDTSQNYSVNLYSKDFFVCTSNNYSLNSINDYYPIFHIELLNVQTPQQNNGNSTISINSSSLSSIFPSYGILSKILTISLFSLFFIFNS